MTREQSKEEYLYNKIKEQSLKDWITICEANVKSARTEEEKLRATQRLLVAVEVLNNLKQPLNQQEVI